MSEDPSTRGEVPKTQNAPKATFLRSMRIVAWGFLGVRKNSKYHEDLGQANPFHLIIAAFLGVLVFIGVLLLAVKWAVSGT